MTQLKQDLFELLVSIIIVAIIIVAASVGFIKLYGMHDELMEKKQIKDDAREVYNARFPKVGDRIELDGKEIVIMKEYAWCKNRTFRVRLPNGELTDILRGETIDIKPIKKDFQQNKI